MSDLYEELADCHPDIKKGLVECHFCGRELRVDPADCFKNGWPECCERTMAIKE